MEIEKTNKVTHMAKKNGKSNARGEKCLAKFTAANGNVYGSLTLDFATASSCCACVSWWTKDFPALRKIIHYGRMVGSLRL